MIVHGDSRWRPRNKAQRDKLFSAPKTAKVVSTGKTYKPACNPLHAEHMKTSVPSLETTACDVGLRPAHELTVPGSVMAGHKSNYMFVTDLSLVPVMGKKNAY